MVTPHSQVHASNGSSLAGLFEVNIGVNYKRERAVNDNNYNFFVEGILAF